MPPMLLVAVLRLAFGLLVLVAIGWQLWLHIGLHLSVPNFFSFFTNISNLFAAGVLIAGALRPWVNSVLHHVMPVVMVLDWLLWPPRPAVGFRPLRWVLAAGALYLAYTMVRGAMVGWYPYPFLNPANVGGYGGVAVYAAGVALTFALGGWVLMAWANRRVRSAT